MSSKFLTYSNFRSFSGRSVFLICSSSMISSLISSISGIEGVSISYIMGLKLDLQ